MKHNQREHEAFEKLRDQKDLPLVKEFLLFLRDHKAWWMVPILLSIGLIALFVALSSTGAAPFIYSLF